MNNPLPGDHPYKNVAPVPEPASLALLGLLAVSLSNRGGLMALRRRK